MNPFECPNCKKDWFDWVEKRWSFDGDFVDETITCECKTVFRIYEEDDFGDWTQEVISHIDPNQLDLKAPKAELK